MPRQNIIQKVIEFGRLRGFVTFDELNELWHELLPSTETTPEEIETVLGALSDEGIRIIEDDQP
jgi:RNA polymerase primary sigma factor